MKDWEIAGREISEPIDKTIFNRAKELLYDSIKFVNENSFDGICNNLDKLYYFIGEAGTITNIFGTGRPESGSEHIFAKKLEEKILVPHGISVAIGIVVFSILQNNFSKDINDCIAKLCVLNDTDKYHINRKIIKEVIKELKPRKDRYSVVDSLNKKTIDYDIIFKVLTKVKGGDFL